MKFYHFILFFFAFNTWICGQHKMDLNSKHLRVAQIYAASALIDSTAPGGFGRSYNVPQSIETRFAKQEGLFLWIDDQQLATSNSTYNQYNLYIGNKSIAVVAFVASDSRLSVVAEVYYQDKWQAIEYLPSSWCGNSYHKVYLKPSQYWAFQVPKFTGTIATKLRYSLRLPNNTYLYSNEIATSINKEQFNKEEKPSSNNIMDPYKD